MQKDLRAAFRATRAPTIAALFGVPRPWTTEPRASDYFAYFADVDRLLVIAGPEVADDVDRALAYGLSYAGDRDLWLALPAGFTAATLDRAAFLDVPVRVFEHDGARVTPLVIPSRPQVFERAKESELAARTHDLADGERFVAGLVAWADIHPDLNTAHRGGYLAWHCRGRQVLKLTRRTGGVDLTAGVAEIRARLYAAPLRDALTTALSGDALVAVRSAIQEAVDCRMRGDDHAPDEHGLQAVLGNSTALGFRPIREFPALRATDRGWSRAFIDLLGVSGAPRWPRMHIVETKLGADVMMVLQGLDYWIWAEANRALLTAELNLPHDAPFQIDFVVGAKNGVYFGTHSASQAEALSGAIPWRFRQVSGWFEGAPVLDDFPRRGAVRVDGREPNRHTTPRFQRRLHLDLAGPSPAGTFHPDVEHGLVPAAIPLFRSLQAQGLAHPLAAHVRSSQTFALNLFAPLSESAVADLLARLFGPVVSVEPVVFEFVDAEDRLHERSAASNHTTQVDVVLAGRAADRRRVVLLIEVKLSEIDFGSCTAYERADATERKTCCQPGAFGGAARSCAQLANRGDPERRRYDAWIPEVAGSREHAGCPLRLGLNQPMRNIALARLIAGAGEADRVAYALCAHDQNVPVWRRWREVKSAFGERYREVEIADLPASEVVGMHAPATAARIAKQYRLRV